MKYILLKATIILIPFILYQLFFCFLVNILLQAHKSLLPTYHEYLRIIIFNMIYIGIAILFTILNLRFLKTQNYKWLITSLIFLVGLMGWFIDAISLENYDIMNNKTLAIPKYYIIKECRTFILALAIIGFYWLAPKIMSSKTEKEKTI